MCFSLKVYMLHHVVAKPFINLHLGVSFSFSSHCSEGWEWERGPDDCRSSMCVCVCLDQMGQNSASSNTGGVFVKWHLLPVTIQSAALRVCVRVCGVCRGLSLSSGRITFSPSFLRRFPWWQRERYGLNVHKVQHYGSAKAEDMKHRAAPTCQMQETPSTERRWRWQPRCPSLVSVFVSAPASRTYPLWRPNPSNSASTHLREAKNGKKMERREENRREKRLMAAFIGISELFSSWIVPWGKASPLLKSTARCLIR